MFEIQTARLTLSCKVTEKRKHTQIHCVTLDSRHRLAFTTPAQMPSVFLNIKKNYSTTPPPESEISHTAVYEFNFVYKNQCNCCNVDDSSTTSL